MDIIEEIAIPMPIEEIPSEAAAPCVEEEVKAEPIGKVRVTHPSLRKRSEPSTDGEVLGLIQDQGVYDIYAQIGGWGRLVDGAWIALDFTETVEK